MHKSFDIFRRNKMKERILGHGFGEKKSFSVALCGSELVSWTGELNVEDIRSYLELFPTETTKCEVS